MNAAEEKLYLRNLAIVVRADNVIAPQEDSLVEQILSELRLAAGDWEAALSAVGKGDKIELQGLSRFSARVRCVEDMIHLSLSDGKMDQSERKVLFNAAKDAGMTPQQIVTMIEEAKLRSRTK